MKYVVCFFMFLNIYSLSSQVYSLEDCIQRAMEKSIDIRIQKLNKESAFLQNRQAKYNLLPSVNIGSGVNYNLGYSISPLDYSFIEQNSLSGSLNLSAQVTLFQGFQQLKNIQKTKIDYQVWDYQIKQIENNLKIQVISLYLQSILEYEVLKSLRHQLDFSEHLYNSKKELLEEGILAENTIREFKLQIEIDKANIERQVFQIQNSLNKMKVLLQFSEFQDFEIDTNVAFFEAPQWSKKEIINNSFESMPDVEIEKLKLSASQKQIEITKGALFPTLTLGYAFGSNFINTAKTYEYRTIRNPTIGFFGDSNFTFVRSLSNQQVPISEQNVSIFSQLGNNKQHQFQLNFQWAIFSKFSKRTNIKLAEIAVKQQEERIDLTVQKLKENYNQAIANRDNAFQKYKYNIIVSKAQEEKFKMAKEKFESNLIDYFELMNYQNQYQTSKIELSKSKLEWYFNQKIIDLYN
jgi:outer membrane protein